MLAVGWAGPPGLGNAALNAKVTTEADDRQAVALQVLHLQHRATFRAKREATVRDGPMCSEAEHKLSP